MIELLALTKDHEDIEAVARINDEAFPPEEHMDIDEMFSFVAKTDRQ